MKCIGHTDLACHRPADALSSDKVDRSSIGGYRWRIIAGTAGAGVHSMICRIRHAFLGDPLNLTFAHIALIGFRRTLTLSYPRVVD